MDYGIIGGIIILAIIIAVFVVELKKRSQNKEAANEFLGKLADNVLDIILSNINEAKPGEYTSIEEFETALLSDIYTKTWKFVSAEVEKSEDVDTITKTFLKYIDENTVANFINSLIDKNGITDTISDIWEDEVNRKSEEEDKALVEEYSDEEKYIESSNDDDLVAAKTEESTTSNEEINPARDEDEDYNVEDDSMELITHEKEIISTTSKTGQTLYYEVDEDGKKKRVSKEYALAHME